MQYISTPLTILDNGSQLTIQRSIEEVITLLDNLVDLIVFTPKGTFSADPDFGFEYWDYEYANVSENLFNNNVPMSAAEQGGEGAKTRCQNSVKQSLATYAPQLKDVEVTMQIERTGDMKPARRKVASRRRVDVMVQGYIDDGLGTRVLYTRPVVFLMEPTARRFRR